MVTGYHCDEFVSRVAAMIVPFPQYEQKRYYAHLLQEMLITRQVG